MSVIDEMVGIINGEIDVLMHYGMPRRSGRYPWGSGEDPYQRTRDFISRVEELQKKGWKETPENIQKEFGINTTQYRIEKKIAKDYRRSQDVARAKSLREDGLSNSEIGRKMGVNESTVRSWFNAESEARMNVAKNTADFLKEQVKKKGMIDVGSGVERELNISREQFNTALYMLEREGYPVYKGGIKQATNPSQQTNQKVLCPPGTKHGEIYDFSKVNTVKDYITRDGGDTYEKKFHYPASLDSKRLQIRYAEDGGIEKDGVVEIRRGCKDLSLGNSHYSQVRILVDGTHYIKGMAVYSDDLPDGVDVLFNTNKTKKTAKMDVLKEIKKDPDNPFGSAIKDADQGGQYWYTDKDGKKKLGLINKRADEGDWGKWKDKLPSQFLAKQSLTLAKQQLNIEKQNKYDEFEEIKNLTNPTVKKHLLGKFADSCDSAAVDLKAAALPGQKYNVIIPMPTLKDTEIYAPNYPNGTKLALVRYPHGGTFEIPILTVNNKHPEGKKVLGKDPLDAVGINSRVAERLSGADFDGDTVMTIPTHNPGSKVKITSTNALKGLEGFDPKTSYGPDTYKDRTIKFMKDPKTGKDSTQMEMGKISNLITDMTLAGANESELARAVRHSMVVIDAGKHKLDYKQSEIDNNISELKRKYQVSYDKNGNLKYGGASTLLSRSSGQASVLKRQGEAKINQKGKDWYDPSKPEGSLIYNIADDVYYPVRSYNKDTGIMTLRTKDGKKISYDVNNKKEAEEYTPIEKKDKNGNVIYTNKSGTLEYKVSTRTQKSTNMLETDDARTLMSAHKHPMEVVYAEYANSMKALANEARKEMISTGKLKYNKDAKAAYKEEVSSLMAKLNTAKLNAVRERAAQRKANVEVDAKINDDPNMSNGDIKKARQQAISKYREEVGSVTRKDRNIEITDKEWAAIQAGAISENTLTQILNNADIDVLREKATPRAKTTLSPAKISMIQAMSSKYTNAEIAAKLGISPSTVAEHLKGAR